MTISFTPTRPSLGYPAALLLVACSTLFGLFLAAVWGTSAVDILYLPAVLGAAVFAGLGPALFAAIASALAYNYFFTAPVHTLLIHRPQDVVTVAVLFVVALVTSQLASSVRAQAQLAAAHAARNATIAGFARELLSSSSDKEIAQIAATELAELFDCNAVILAGAPDLGIKAASSPSLSLNPSDLAVAALVASNGHPAGRGITAAMAVEWQFFPVIAKGSTIAVVGLARDDGMPAVRDERRPLLASLLDQAALAFERARLEREARTFATVRERDHVRTTLLSSIAKDLAEPLAVLRAAADSLRRSGEGDRESLQTIGTETARLSRYLANLADLAPDDEQLPIDVGPVRIDLFRRAVTRNGETVHLTPKEFAVLAELAKHRGRVLSHAHLLRTAWGPAQEKQAEYLRVAVRGLRQKLENDPKRPALILNEPSVGYRLAG